jgi:hypothetical protein
MRNADNLWHSKVEHDEKMQYFKFSSLIMEAARTSETSINNYFTGQYIPEDNSELHDKNNFLYNLSTKNVMILT